MSQEYWSTTGWTSTMTASPFWIGLVEAAPCRHIELGPESTKVEAPNLSAPASRIAASARAATWVSVTPGSTASRAARIPASATRAAARMRSSS